MNKNQELFENAPVPRAVTVMAVPTIITMLVVVIYNMADTFFIGQTKDAMQVAAGFLAAPGFMVFLRLAICSGSAEALRFRERSARAAWRKPGRFQHSAVMLRWGLA